MSRQGDLPASIAFVVGARRTGTTVLYSLLCASEDTHPFAGEFQILTQLLNAFAWGRGNYERMVRFFFQAPGAFDDYEKRTVRDLVAEAVATLAPRRCAVFKNPELSLHIEALANILPEAKFVAMVRDPRDQIVSEFGVIARQFGAGARTGAAPNAQRLAADYAAYYKPICALHRAQPERVAFVRYEDLVTAPDPAIRQVCDFLAISPAGIDPHTEWDFGKVDKQAMRARPSWSELYGRPVSKDRVGRYRTDLTQADIKVIEKEAADFMIQFHYAAQ